MATRYGESLIQSARRDVEVTAMSKMSKMKNDCLLIVIKTRPAKPLQVRRHSKPTLTRRGLAL